MRTTRQAILDYIKQHDHATVGELAQSLNLSPVSIRHHLYRLMADGLVERQPVRRGVGRPEHSYSLTDAGYRLFPSRYHVLATHLLNTLKHIKPEEDVQALLEAIIRQLLTLPAGSGQQSPAERLDSLAAYFQENGIPVRIYHAPDGHAEIEMACPYYYVSQTHPELCSIDEKIMGEVLQLPTTRITCLLDGNKSCTFNIQLEETSAVGETVSGSDT